MDTFTRRYVYLLGAAVVAVLLWWLSSLDFRVRHFRALSQYL